MNEHVLFENKYRKVYTRKNGTKYFMFEKKRKDVGNIPIIRGNKLCKPTEDLHVNGKCYKKCPDGKIRSVTTNRCVKSSQRRQSSPRQCH